MASVYWSDAIRGHLASDLCKESHRFNSCIKRTKIFSLCHAHDTINSAFLSLLRLI